jgi:phosphoglucosamine mutase
VLERFGSDLSGLKIVVDCANGAYAHLAPKAFEQLGAHVFAIGDEPDGTNINVGFGATDLRALQQAVTSRAFDLGVAFDGDGDRMLAVDASGNAIDGDQILAVLALARRVDLVAVTVMTNLGFHKLMEKHGIRVVTTDVGDRYVLEALRREGGILGGEQSGPHHLARRPRHRRRPRAALLLCAALDGRTLEEAVSVLELMPQALEKRPGPDEGDPPRTAGRNRCDRGGKRRSGYSSGRPAPSRSSGCWRRQKPLKVRGDLCARIATLVARELRLNPVFDEENRPRSRAFAFEGPDRRRPD